MKRTLLNKSLLILLCIGLLVRVSLLFYDYSWDVNSHLTWGKESVERGFPGFYERMTHDQFATKYPNYPPLPIYAFSGVYLLYEGIKGVLWQINIHVPAFPSGIFTWFDSRGALAGCMKIPAVIFDLGVGAMLYLITFQLTKKKNISLLAAAFFILNPAFIYTSAHWGQIESIPIFFLLAAFYTLMCTKRALVPWILLTLALLSKQTGLVFVPFFLFLYLKQYPVKDALIGFFMSLLIFMTLFLPFYAEGNIVFFSFETYFVRIASVSGIPFASNHAFNFWALITKWKDVSDMTKGLGLAYRYWGYGITLLLALPFVILLWKKKITLSTALYGAGLIAFTGYLFLTKIHERHIEQALVFFIPVAVQDKRMRIIFGILSALHILNLYHNWSSPRIELAMPFVLSLITVNTAIVALIGIYAYLYYRFLKRL